MKKTNASILVIDDQEDILFASKMLLKKHFENIFTLNNPKNVVDLLAKNTINESVFGEIDIHLGMLQDR